MIIGFIVAGFFGFGGGGCEFLMIVFSLFWVWIVCFKESVEGVYRVFSRWRGGLWGF